jgi:tetratricopeptide (TPR) repeat protein
LAQTPGASDALDDFALVEQLAAQAASATSSPTGGRAARATRFQAHSVDGRSPGLGGVGTIAYMPPEQWDIKGNVGPPADLYAFGLILSELLAGRHGLADLEADLDEDDWYRLHLHGAPRPLRTGPAESANRLPAAVEQLYQALLAKRPESRPTAEEALSVLRQAASQLGEEPYVWREHYLRTDEHRQMAWHNWAATCLDFDLLEEALVRTERALALDPRRSSTLNIRGNISARFGQRELEARDTEQGILHLEEALDWHSQAIAAATTDSDRALAQGMKAARLNELSRYAEAEIAYAAALTIDSAHGGTWQNRARNEWAWARAERDAGRREEARRLYALALSHAEESLRRSPSDPETLRIFTSVQRERDRLDP